MKHHRVVVTRHGGPDVLQMIEEDCPEPGPGEARVKVLAAGVSAYDIMFRRSGQLPGSPKTPFTPGVDIVGLVDRLGEGAAGLQPGQMAAGATFCLGSRGGYSEYLCLPAGELVPVPAGLDPAEAVCLVVNYLTAHMALHQTAGVRGGERVLVHGAAGGVGTAMLELGRLAGLELYGTASSHNHALVSQLGATPIDYHTEDFVRRIRELTGEGADAVFDPIGGARQIRRSYQAVRAGGRLVWFGAAAVTRSRLQVIPFSMLAFALSSMLTIALLKLFPGGKQTRLVSDLGKDKAWYCATLAELINLHAAGRLKPVVAERIPLAEAARAHALLERGRYAGKVVLTI